MDAQIMEIQGLSVFGTFSIAFALRSIGSIIAIWLALRIANNIRTSEEDNIVAKILGSGFGVLTVMFVAYWQTAYWSLRANTANNFKEMGESMELSAGVQQFVNSFASAEPVTAPGMIVIIFDLIVLARLFWQPSGCRKNSCKAIAILGGLFAPQIRFRLASLYFLLFSFRGAAHEMQQAENTSASAAALPC